MEFPIAFSHTSVRYLVKLQKSSEAAWIIWVGLTALLLTFQARISNFWELLSWNRLCESRKRNRWPRLKELGILWREFQSRHQVCYRAWLEHLSASWWWQSTLRVRQRTPLPFQWRWEGVLLGVVLVSWRIEVMPLFAVLAFVDSANQVLDAVAAACALQW